MPATAIVAGMSPSDVAPASAGGLSRFGLHASTVFAVLAWLAQALSVVALAAAAFGDEAEGMVVLAAIAIVVVALPVTLLATAVAGYMWWRVKRVRTGFIIARAAAGLLAVLLVALVVGLIVTALPEL
jgi:hypothetical protein